LKPFHQKVLGSALPWESTDWFSSCEPGGNRMGRGKS